MYKSTASTIDAENDSQDVESFESSLPSMKRQRVMIATILCLIFCSFCADTIIYPFFPNVAIEKGLTSTEVGTAFSAYDFSRFLAAPIVGSLLTRCHPKKVCGIGSIITALASVCFGVAALTSSGGQFLALSITARLLGGVGSAMLNVAGTSLLMKGTSYQPGTIIGIIETMNGFGYSAGPAFGAALFEVVGYTYTFCVIGFFIIGFLVVYLFAVPRIEERQSPHQKKIFSLCLIPGVFLMFLSWSVFKLIETSRSTEYSIFFSSTFQINPTQYALILGGWSVLYMLSGVVFTRFFNKVYAFSILLVTWSLITILNLLIVPSPPFDILFEGKSYLASTIVVGALSNSICIAQYITPFPAALDLAVVNGHARDSLHTYGMLTGLMNCGLCLGSTIGPVLSGAFTDLVGFAWDQTIFDTLSLLMTILIGIYMLYMRCTNQPLSLPQEHKTKVESESDANDHEQSVELETDRLAQRE